MTRRPPQQRAPAGTSRSRLVAVLATTLALVGLAGCATYDDLSPVTTSDGPRGRTPAEERIIAGVAEIVLADRAWPGFDAALPNRINTVSDGEPLYVHIRAARPLGELAHPADGNASAAFARFPYLLLQVGDIDSMRIVNTCYVTLTPEEAARQELIVPLAPMVRRPGNSPTDCWLTTVSSQPAGRLQQEIRLAGFAGKFERWLPVPDILAVAPIDADLSTGSANYSALLRTPTQALTPQAASPGSAISRVGPPGSGLGSATSPAGAGSTVGTPPRQSGPQLQSPPQSPPQSQPPSPPRPVSSLPSASPLPATVPTPVPTPARIPTPLPAPVPAVPSGSGPVATSAPIIIANPVPAPGQPRPLPGSTAPPLRASMGGDRLEAQLQALATALLGRRPSETYFTDNYWLPANNQPSQALAEQAHAAAVFRGQTCSWTRLRVLRRPGSANIADIERIGSSQEVPCENLR